MLPTTQRSWIGKAHLLPPSSFPVGGHGKNDEVTDLIKPVYYDPRDASTHASPQKLQDNRASKNVSNTNGFSNSRTDDFYVLVPGTPATCVQLGLFHHSLLFPGSESTDQAALSYSSAEAAPIDLILSGPNYGRNTTAAFALSSGTIGGALEGAVCGVRAIAVSFAFFTRQETLEMTREACTHSAKIVDRLMADWENGGAGTADLYSINVPLSAGISQRPVKWTWMLDNKWSSGSLYKAISPIAPQDKGSNNEGGATEDLRRPSGEPPTFRWSPQFGDVFKTVEKSAAGNDGLVIREHSTSITPLKANFQGVWGLGGFKGEMKL